MTVKDGQKAVDFLLKRDGYASDTNAAPLVILLDLNMPVLVLSAV